MINLYLITPRNIYEVTNQSRELDKEEPCEVPLRELYSGLGGRVLGICNMNTGSTAIGKDLPHREKRHARAHELAHKNGTRDEYQADLLAAQETGDVSMIRGPFYRPPIWLN